MKPGALGKLNKLKKLDELDELDELGNLGEAVEKDEFVRDDVEMECEEGFSGDFTSEELADFLSADSLDVKADPFFKEDLRKRLWSLVSDRYGRGPGNRGH